MRFTVRRLSSITILALAGAAFFGLPMATGAKPAAKPVIGKAVASPAQPVAGQPLAVSVRVARSDTGGPLTRGLMACRPAAGARVLPHTQTFRGGVARCSFAVPETATSVRVAFTITSGGQSASKTFTFAVRPAPKPALSIGDVTAAEGNSGTTTMTFPVTLSKASRQSVTVAYATANGTAVAPGDYAAANGSLAFAPGETSKSIAVSVVADTAIEPDETLTVTLSGPVNATLARAAATGTIKNEDTQVQVFPGSYKGALPSGDYLYFEVTAARQVSYFRLNDLRENCDPGGYFEGSVSYPREALWPISDDGNAGQTDVWTGSQNYGDIHYTHYEYRTTVKFNGTATVTGTIQLIDEFDYAGYHFTCNTGVVPWTATMVG